MALELTKVYRTVVILGNEEVVRAQLLEYVTRFNHLRKKNTQILPTCAHDFVMHLRFKTAFLVYKDDIFMTDHFINYETFENFKEIGFAVMQNRQTEVPVMLYTASMPLHC